MNDKKKAILQSKLGLMIVCLISALVTVSCASTSSLSTRASRVRLISALQAHEVEDQCEFLGNVRGSYPYGGCCMCWGVIGCWTYHDKALNELLDNSAELGATHVFVNLGNGMELRGEAYCCAYCKLPDGNPDVDYCQGPDGNPDMDYCQGPEGNPIGAAHCEGAEGKNLAECKANGGKWIRAIDEPTCEVMHGRWIPKAEARSICEARGGLWRPKARDKISCESKGGTWVMNEDVLRRAPSPIKAKE